MISVIGFRSRGLDSSSSLFHVFLGKLTLYPYMDWWLIGGGGVGVGVEEVDKCKDVGE